MQICKVADLFVSGANMMLGWKAWLLGLLATQVLFSHELT